VNDNFSYGLFSTAWQSAIEPFITRHSPTILASTEQSLHPWHMSSTPVKLVYAQKALHSTNAQLDLSLAAVLLTHATQVYVEILNVATPPAYQQKAKPYLQQCLREGPPL
jgi:hypothetical protein